MNRPRLTITHGMRQFLDYPKFAGSTRMLILETQYFFDASWRRSAENLGWQTASIPSVMVGSLTREHIESLFTTLALFKPDFILTSNFAGMDADGLFARFFEDARIPYVSWFTDTPRMILYDRHVHSSHYAVAATWERAYIPHFQQLGFQHILFMPLATDPAVFSGKPAASFERNLAFVGMSMIEQANEAWEKIEQLPDIAKEILNAFSAGRVTRESFAEGISAILEPALLENGTPSDLRNIELCIIYEATRRQRAELAVRLDPLGIEVRGDEHWRHVASRTNGTVAYFSGLAPFYRSTAVNLNSTSIQMKTAVNQRVFDCPAAGGFLITDAQADLLELFEPDTEIVTYASLDELEDKVRFYLAHPELRSEIIHRAQQRIIAHHTHRNRLETLERYLKERYA